MFLSLEEKFRCIKEAQTTADLAEERFHKIWDDLKYLLKKRPTRSSSHEISSNFINQPVEVKSDLTQQDGELQTRNAGSSRRTNSGKSLKPKRQSEKIKPLTKTKFRAVQPFKLRKNKEDPTEKRVFGFGGYTVLPKDNMRLLYIRSVKSTPGWRTKGRRLQKERKELNNLNSNSEEFKSHQKKISSDNHSLLSLKESRKKLYQPTQKTSHSSMYSYVDVKQRLTPISLSRNSSEHFGHFRKSTGTLGDTIEALLNKVVNVRKNINFSGALKGCLTSNSARPFLIKDTCPAKSCASSFSTCCDPSEKWSTPLPAPCTCFPRAHSVEVLERSYSLKSISSNICKILM